MDKINLTTIARDPKVDLPDKLRKQDLVPTELYGHKVKNVHLSVKRGELEKLLRAAGESSIISAVMPDQSERNVLIHDVQRHYLHGQPIHIDLFEVKMTEKLTTTVPLEFTGESDAVEVKGGTLVKVISEVEIECFPADLPQHLEVDITMLKTFEDQILIKDIKVSSKVEIQADPEEVVAKVQEPRDVEADLAEPIDADISKVEGVAEDKPVDEDSKEEKKDK